MTALGPKLTQTMRNYETNTSKNDIVTVPRSMCYIAYCVPSLKHWREFGSMARVPYSLQKTH